MTALVVLLLIGGVGGLVGYAYTSQRNRAEERATAVETAAEHLGWGYRREVDYKSVPDLHRFELFRTGSSRKLSNLLTSPRDELRAVVFDYQYTVSSGNSSQTFRQTVFYITGADLSLPTFSMRPENFFHRVGQVFGYQDIDIERHPEFSRMYLLRGEDEAAVRRAFNSGVADFFERRPGSCAAGTGRELLYWRGGKLAEAGEYEALIRDGYMLAQRFAQPPTQS